MAVVLNDPALYTFTGGQPLALPALRDRYAQQLTGWSPDGTQRWSNWIVRLRVDRIAIGYVQATIRNAPGRPAADVAWVIGSQHQGRGFAREAAQLMLSSLQAEGVHVVGAHIHPDHHASAAVARYLGLSATGIVVDGEVYWQREM
jgi:RimJ/RimL family protein N-acetyltransferase